MILSHIYNLEYNLSQYFIMLNMEQHGEIILFQPDETAKLEVRLEDETV